MRPSRRRLLGTAAAASLSLPRFAKAAAEFEWRLGHAAPEDFPLHKRLVEAANEIDTKTDGRVQISIYANGQLGGQLGLLQQVRSGAIQITPVTGQSLTGVLAKIFVQSVGFAFPDYATVWAALDGDLGKGLRAAIQERLGIVPMTRCWDFGFRQLTTRDRVVKSAVDIEGLKIRVPIDPDLIWLFRSLTAVPLGMNLQDMMPAFLSHAVDGQEGVLPLALAAGVYQQQTYCASTNHVWDGQWLCVNAQAWLKLPDTSRQIVAAAFDAAALRQRDDTAAIDTNIRNELTKFGMIFNGVDPDGFRSLLREANYYAKASERVGDDLWAALEKYAGRLA